MNLTMLAYFLQIQVYCELPHFVLCDHAALAMEQPGNSQLSQVVLQLILKWNYLL